MNARGPFRDDRLDLVFVAFLGALAFLLGWVELFDPDVWWHVRSGQLIVESRAIPRVDPFTFGSADRPWIDLHWGFQLLLAWAHARGGVAGILLAASTACAGAVVLGVATRRPGWPRWVAAWCWMPALLAMSTRFDPRPEMLSMVGIAATLAVLLRIDRRPAWSWALPGIMAWWVNVHSLFVLGLILIGCFGLGALLGSPEPNRCRGWSLWKHLGPASAVAVAACLANPYGLRGALFPFELIGKISDPQNPYKNYISEFMSPAARVRQTGVEVVAGRIYLQALVFLMMLLPPSFAVPAAWRRWRFERPDSPARPGVWIGGVVIGVVLLGISVIGLPGPTSPSLMVKLAGAMPPVLALAGMGAAAAAARTSRRAGLVLGAGVLASALWCDFLRGHVFGAALAWGGWEQRTGLLGPASVVILLGVAAVVLAIRDAASPFRLLAVAAFTYLGLTADRNSNLFGMVAGTVLAWNWSEWAAALTREGGTDGLRPLATAARAGLGLLLLAWAGLVVTDRFFPLTGYALHFGLRERPYTYAHEAARFAGRPGLPDRAIAFDLQQAGVYVYHNGVERKVFMDGRLEVPTLSTFQTYTRLDELLNDGDPRWAAMVRALGDPLILIDHVGHERAEAAILANPRWRCVHFDPMAAVYLPHGNRELDARYPRFDFEAQHFGGAPTRPRPDNRLDDYIEARALLGIAENLAREAPASRGLGVGMGVLAQDRAWRALSARPDWPGPWTILGHLARLLPPAGSGRPVGPDEAWDPTTGLGVSQATYAYRRALDLDPKNRPALRALKASFEARRMSEASSALDPEAATRRYPADPPQQPGGIRSESPDRVMAILDGWLKEGRTETVALLASGKEAAGWPWPVAERLAASAMHRGHPDQARAIWEGAGSVPSAGLRHARVGDSLFASWQFEKAAESYARALDLEPDLGVAYVGLALARFRQGRAVETREACRRGQSHATDPTQRVLLTRLSSLTP